MNNYIVQKGDTLYGIAKRFNTSVQSIKELNNLSSNNLSIGTSLKINKNNNDTEPMECIVYTVKKGDSLYSIASKYNTTVNEIKRYNNLNSDLLNIGDRIVIPCNVENDYKTGEEYVMYTVVKGDSLYSIASKFNTTVDNIKKINGLSNNNLAVGQKLIIDDKSGVSSVLECFGSGNFDNTNYINYMVVKGDNLYNLARKYNTSVEEIKRINYLKSNDLSVGEILKIPNTNSNTYIVQKGESLYSIAKKFNTTVNELKKKNNLTTNLISVGKELII